MLSTVLIWRNPRHTPQVHLLLQGRPLLRLVQLGLFSQLRVNHLHEMERLKVEWSPLYHNLLCRCTNDPRQLFNSCQIHSSIFSTIWVHLYVPCKVQATTGEHQVHERQGLQLVGPPILDRTRKLLPAIQHLMVMFPHHYHHGTHNLHLHYIHLYQQQLPLIPCLRCPPVTRILLATSMQQALVAEKTW